MAGGPIRLVIASKFDPKGINKGKSSLKNFGVVAGKIGLASVAAIAGIGTAALKMSSEFETSFAKIQGLVGVSADQIGVLEDAAKTLGPQFGKSAQRPRTPCSSLPLRVCVARTLRPSWRLP